MRVVVVIVLAAVSLATQSGGPSPAALAVRLEKELAAARVPGAAIAIVAGDAVHAAGYGVADAGTSDAMTPATLLQAGSLTKLFTAVAVVAALDAGQRPLETTVGAVKPGLATRAATATFHQLLSHTAGLRDREGGSGSDDELALAATARELSADDFILPAGLVFSYSNLGYALAGAGLESMSRKGFAEALRERALVPLGMEQSTIRLSEALARSHAAGHRLDGESVLSMGPPASDTRLWPSGYLWTNATDLSRALAALLNQGRVSGHPGVEPTVIERVTSAHAPMPNVFVGGHYGYGLMIARDRGTLVYEHGGTLPGFSSILRVTPERRLGVAIVANLDNAPLRRIAQVVMAEALNLPAPAAAPRRETPVTAAEMTPLFGRYENRGAVELRARGEDVVVSLMGGPPLPVARLDDHRYIARAKPGAPGPEFVLRPATPDAPGYLHFALWAFVRR